MNNIDLFSTRVSAVREDRKLHRYAVILKIYPNVLKFIVAGGVASVDSFIRKAILNELCETATRDIHKLKSDTLVNLVR